jgi:hypothetical protein
MSAYPATASVHGDPFLPAVRPGGPLAEDQRDAFGFLAPASTLVIRDGFRYQDCRRHEGRPPAPLRH